MSLLGWSHAQLQCSHAELSALKHREYVAFNRVRYRATWATCLACGVSVQQVERVR